MAEEGETPDVEFTEDDDPVCPTCGRTDLRSWRGVKQHHSLQHDEPLTPVSPGWLEEQYWEKGMSGREIAEIVGVEPNSVRRWMKKHGIELRDKYEARADGDTRPLKDADWLGEHYLENRRSSGEIGEELGVSGNVVRSWLERHGIERRDRARARTNGRIELLEDEEWVREQYLDEKTSAPDIAEECGVHSGTVYTYLEKHGIDRRSIIEARTDEGNLELLRDAEWLHEQYWEQCRSTTDIADECDVSENALTNWMDRHGIERRDASAARAEGNVEPLKDAEWLQEQYVDNERTMVDIAEECGVGISTVRRNMDRLGIERRTMSEAMTEGDLERLQDAEWMAEQHIEKGRTAQQIGEECEVSGGTVIKWIHRHGIPQRTHINYSDPDHLDHPVRSEWEKEIAELLLDHGIDYEYESQEIEWENGRIYTPDFVTEDYVIEVKGRVYDYGVQNAEETLKQLDRRDYVVIGSKEAVQELPADHHYLWEDRSRLLELFN